MAARMARFDQEDPNEVRRNDFLSHPQPHIGAPPHSSSPNRFNQSYIATDVSTLTSLTDSTATGSGHLYYDHFADLNDRNGPQKASSANFHDPLQDSYPSNYKYSSSRPSSRQQDHHHYSNGGRDGGTPLPTIHQQQHHQQQQNPPSRTSNYSASNWDEDATQVVVGLDDSANPVAYPAIFVAAPLPKKHHHHSSPKRSMLGPYVLLKTIGEGEFGKVKLAYHVKDPTYEVAIKLIKKENIRNPVKRAKILREISILKSLDHPYIVRLLEVVETDQYIGMVMEYASGGELFEYILAHRYLKERDACRFFAQLLAGVSYIHSVGIVHRDLKLENLLLDSDRNVIITDFGFANRCRSGDVDILMQTSCGSPCYAAPELVVSEGYAGEAADIWSCGVILYAMLSGYLPFDDDPENPDGDNINLLYKYILETSLEFPDHISEDAKSLLSRMLVPDPRYRAKMPEVISHRWLLPAFHIFEEEMLRIKSAMATTQISTPPTSPSAMPTEEPAEVEIDDEEEEYEMADDSIAGTGIKPEDPLRQESLDEPMREVRTEERPAIASPPQSPTPPASVSPLPPVPPEPSRDSFVSFSQQRDLKADILSLFESALSDHPPQSALPTVGAATLAGFGKRESMAEDHVGNKFMLTSRTPSPQASFISNIVLANSPPPPAESTTLRDGTSLTPVDMARQPISDSTLLALHSSDPVEQLVDEGDVKTEVSVTVAALDIEQEGTFGRRGRGHSFLSPVGVTPHDYGRTSKHGGGKSSIVSWLMHKPKDTRKSFDDSKSTMSRTKSVRSNHSTKPEEDTSVISDEIVAATPAGSSGGESRSGLRPPVPEHFDMSASSPSRSSVGPNSSRKSFSADAISELMENDKVPHLPSVLIQKLKEFSGPIDRRALTSREPSSLLADLEVFFEDNGFVIQANGRERGEMFLRLVRKQPATPPRQQRAATALGTLPEIASPEPATPPRGTTPRRGAARGSSVPPPGRVPTTPGYTPSTPNARHYTSGSGSAAAFGHGPGASASSNRWRSGSTKSANKLAQAVMASLPVSFVRRLKRNNADHGGGGGGGSASTSGSSSASASSLFGLDSVENHDQQQLHNSAPQLHSQDPDAWVGPKAHSGDDGTTSIEDEDGAAAQHRASVVESLTRQPVPLPPPSSSHKKRNHHISFWNDKKRSPPSSTYGASSPPPPASHLAHHRTGAGFHQDTAAVAAAIAMTSATSVVEEEVKFNVEIEQIPNLPGLYVVHFKRIRGDVWEFKKLYHKVIREVLEKDKDA